VEGLESFHIKLVSCGLLVEVGRRRRRSRSSGSSSGGGEWKRR